MVDPMNQLAALIGNLITMYHTLLMPGIQFVNTAS